MALTLMLVVLWSSTHSYKSVSGDAELYAFQAMARLHPNLASDLFLQNASQDRYTVFSPFYAWCIGSLGLRNAALTLAMMFKVWFFTAAWALARRLSCSTAAFTAVSLLIITVGTYGAFGVFRYAEDWLTARSLAESLVVSALALHFSGQRVVGLLSCLLAFFVHPLMALPGILLLTCLWCPMRVDFAAATAAVLACLGVALGAMSEPSSTGLLAVIDPEWYEVVHERSVFLFLQYWHVGDWSNNARPFLSLTISAMVLNDDRIRKLCITSMLVGATGLAVAFIAGAIGPVALLIQGQAWRWEWVTCFIGVLLLAPTAALVYRNTKCGPLCAVLLISGWTFLRIDGAACIGLALLLWLAREHIDARMAEFLRWAAGALALAIAAWTAVDAWSAASAPGADPGHEILAILRIRDIAGLQTPAVLLAFLFSYWIVKARSLAVLGLIVLLLGGSAAWILPSAVQDTHRDGSEAQIREFTDWRNVIPPTANVYVAPTHNSAAFAWFTLERPSYLSVDQSAGVVFSRAVAMEVKRRSQVLLPLMQPDWRLLTDTSSSAGGKRSGRAPPLPLTRDRLTSVCRDPQLGFVVARENVGLDPIRHEPRGYWQDWNLYDCRHVRSLARGT